MKSFFFLSTNSNFPQSEISATVGQFRNHIFKNLLGSGKVMESSPLTLRVRLNQDLRCEKLHVINLFNSSQINEQYTDAEGNFFFSLKVQISRNLKSAPQLINFGTIFLKPFWQSNETSSSSSFDFESKVNAWTD